jgi:hypothetical protein
MEWTGEIFFHMESMVFLVVVAAMALFGASNGCT